MAAQGPVQEPATPTPSASAAGFTQAVAESFNATAADFLRARGEWPARVSAYLSERDEAILREGIAAWVAQQEAPEPQQDRHSPGSRTSTSTALPSATSFAASVGAIC